MNFAKVQNQYSNVIQVIGSSVLPNGKTLSENLTIEEIPFWNVFAAELSWRHLTTAVASVSLFDNFLLFIKPYVFRLRSFFKKFSYAQDADNSPPNWPVAPFVLCLGFTNRMYKEILEPVINCLVSESNYHVVVLIDSPHFVRRPCLGVTYQSIGQNWTRDIEFHSLQIQKKVRLIESELFSSGVLASFFHDVDSNISLALRKVLYLLFKAYIPHALRQAVIARQVLRSHRPSLVLSPDVSDYRTRLYTLMAKSMQIPSMEVQFGLTGEEGVEWQFLAADCVAVWGESSKLALLKHGIPKEKIIVTGSPRHDALVIPSISKLASIRKNLGIVCNRPVILLASTYTDWTHTQYARPEILQGMKRAIFDAAKQNPNIILIVKPHPVELVKETRGISGHSKNIIFVDRDSDIRELIVICDAFVSFGSTATVDALIAGKICICPIFPGWPFSESFRAGGAVLAPESAAEITQIFSEIGDTGGIIPSSEIISARRRFLSHLAFEADGLAAARITGHLLAMMK